MTEKKALVLDDRESHLKEIQEQLKAKGYSVTTAKTLKQAKEAAIQARAAGKEFSLIVSDFDLGGKLYLKHRWFDGYRFVKWCKAQGIKSEIIFHSTSFEPSRRIMRFLHGPIIRRAQKRGIAVQGKSKLMPSQRRK